MKGLKLAHSLKKKKKETTKCHPDILMLFHLSVAAEGSSEKAPKASKGNHSSRYAYMLVYQRCKSKSTGM